MSALLRRVAKSPSSPSLRIFDRVPHGHLVFAVHDHSCAPLAQPGEVLVIEDVPRHYPEEGRWFLIQWISDEDESRRWNRDRVGQTIGIPYEIKSDLWGYRPPNNRGPGVTYGGDMGFSWNLMTDRIRGPVVGIYRPGALAGDDQ